MNMMSDDPKCVKELWPFTEGLIRTTPMEGVQAFNDWPAGVVMLGDFEVSHRSVWESHNTRAFFRGVEQHGGIYTARWGDAALRSIAALLSIPRKQIYRFSDISYEMNIGTMAGAAPITTPNTPARQYSQQQLPELNVRQTADECPHQLFHICLFTWLLVSRRPYSDPAGLDGWAATSPHRSCFRVSLILLTKQLLTAMYGSLAIPSSEPRTGKNA